MKVTLKRLKRHALAASLFPPTTLRRAIARLGFVQADPIRSPARAQDLILRHRVKGYRAGDLESCYPSLQLEEDFVYAYGFVPQSTWQLLHPRPNKKLTKAEQRVLELVCAQKHLHPRELEAHLGREREINAWGGYSKATTRTLQALHYRGLLRVAGRENGIRLYESISPVAKSLEPEERLSGIILLIASILQPLPLRSLRSALQHLAHAWPASQARYSALTALLESGRLTTAMVDDVPYVWPSGPNGPEASQLRRPVADRVRFLAPFDPLVWDRLRFEHFWGWRYRFEAYTPAPKRKLGYYAMPLLWRDDVVGWVNASNRARDFSIEAGFNKARPAETSFQTEFEAEVERFRDFLQPRDT